MRFSTLLPLALLLSLVVPSGAAGQVVRGIVLEAESGLPMGGVEVVLLDTAGVAVRAGATGMSGGFILGAPAPGQYRLRARRLGYEEVVSESVVIGADEVVEVELRLGVRPVALEGLRVVERRKRESLAERDLRERQERIEAYPHMVGYRILDRESLEEVHGWSLQDVLSRRPGRRCQPVLYWNGMAKKPAEVDLSVPIEHLEAVEFWDGHFAPRSFFSDMSGCGVTLVWTR